MLEPEARPAPPFSEAPCPAQTAAGLVPAGEQWGLLDCWKLEVVGNWQLVGGVDIDVDNWTRLAQAPLTQNGKLD